MMPEGAEIGGLLDARLQRVGHADHRRGADAGARHHHPPHLVVGHRAVLHLEPDVVEVLADFAVQLGIEARNGVAGDLLVLQQPLLGAVVERPRRGGIHHRLDLPSPSALVGLCGRDRAADRRACRRFAAGGLRRRLTVQRRKEHAAQRCRTYRAGNWQSSHRNLRTSDCQLPTSNVPRRVLFEPFLLTSEFELRSLLPC